MKAMYDKLWSNQDKIKNKEQHAKQERREKPTYRASISLHSHGAGLVTVILIRGNSCKQRVHISRSGN